MKNKCNSPGTSLKTGKNGQVLGYLGDKNERKGRSIYGYVSTFASFYRTKSVLAQALKPDKHKRADFSQVWCEKLRKKRNIRGYLSILRKFFPPKLAKDVRFHTGAKEPTYGRFHLLPG